ncbi:hypothetical protein [Deinococcus cellulosilyticus]|uniref:hypothetical protein n=1 Tax=Deinococcus cellulosilyticus TaxID=401558 RepID=UPI0011BE31C6|nr:hypothetical protein [Deinococcus cellulosilyticus]
MNTSTGGSMRKPILSAALLLLSACTPAQQAELATSINKFNESQTLKSKLQYGLKSTLSCTDQNGFTRNQLMVGENSCVLVLETPIDYGVLYLHTQASYLEKRGGIFNPSFEEVNKDGYGKFEITEYVQKNRSRNFVILPFKYFVTDKNFWRSFPQKLVTSFSSTQAVDTSLVEMTLNYAAPAVSLPPNSGTVLVQGSKVITSVLMAVDQYLSADKNPYGLKLFATLCVEDTCSNETLSFVGVNDKH